MYVNAVANNVMLPLCSRHDFLNSVLKIEPELYKASGFAHPPQGTILDTPRLVVWDGIATRYGLDGPGI